jgi:hypothetical protein
MNYTKKSFSVAGPGTKKYADNWERTFRGGDKPEPLPPLNPPRRGSKTVRRLPTDVRYAPFDWIGPWPSDLQDGTGCVLKHPVPPDRWPYGSPLQHEPCCLLQNKGLYCDCKASAADELDWGYIP